MNKKIVLLIAVLVVGVGFLSGCNEEQKNDKLTDEDWGFFEKTYCITINSNFNELISEGLEILNDSYDLGFLFHLHKGNIDEKIENLSEVWEIGNVIETNISDYYNETKEYSLSKKLQEYKEISTNLLNCYLNISKNFKSIYENIVNYEDYNFTNLQIVVVDNYDEELSINMDMLSTFEHIDELMDWSTTIPEEEWNEWAKYPSC